MRNSRPAPKQQPNRQSFLKSFLDSAPSWTPEEQVDNHKCKRRLILESGQSTSCGVCLLPFAQTDKKKICKFCGLSICKDHLRKRRQLNNIFERICDDCEDRYLFDKLKKYQAKAEEAEAVQQQILILKQQDVSDRLRGKQLKMKSLAAQTTEFVAKYQKKHDIMNDELKIMLEKEKDIAMDFTLVEKQQQQQKQQEAKMPRSLEEDLKALQSESDKLNKELIRLEKRKLEMQASLERKEKEIQEEYAKWEAHERAKAEEAKKQKENCLLF